MTPGPSQYGPGRPRRHRTRLRADMPLLGGVRPPLAALLCLLLAVVALAMLALGQTVAEDVAPAVLNSQQHIASDTASDIRAAVNQDVAAIREDATALSGDQATTDAAYLKALTALGTPWRGAALVDPTTGTELATTGEAFPASAVSSVAANETIPPKLVTLTNGQTRLLVFASVDLQGQGTRLLVGSDLLAAPAPGGDLTRTVELVDRHGKVVAGSGPALTATQDKRIPADASSAAAQQGDIANSSTRPSGFLLGSLAGGHRTVAGWADVATVSDGGADALHLVAVVAVSTPQTSAVTGNSLVALIAAASLLGAALLITALLVLGLQRPLLRLHLAGARIARGDLSRPAPQPRLGEAARIGRALEGLRRQQVGSSPKVFQPLKRTFGARALVVLCGFVLVAWSVPLLFVLDKPTSTEQVPAQLISDQQLRTVAAANRVESSLATGYTDVASVAASLSASSTTSRMQQLLASTLKEHSRYRALYVLAQDGSVLTSVGLAPRQQLHHVPPGGGVLQLNTGGKVPSTAVYAVVSKPAPVAGKPQPVTGPGTPVAVVGEFDTSYLNSVLNHAGMGHVYLVDAEHKVIGSDGGFRAFQSLPDPSLTGLAVDNPVQPANAVVPTSDGTAIAAAAPVGVIANVSRQPSWQVVSAQPESWLDLSANRTERLTMLVGLLGLTVSVICLGWLFVVVVRPLRDLAEVAERLAAGDRKTVLYPVHHDEVGSITRSLEIIRQRLGSGGRASASSKATKAGKATNAGSAGKAGNATAPRN
ncbi:HAMP domain-containing protein [Streptacidiphilus fuscans]|uniref:HAMP domain-containing protein n=1 Tax=Streptacidiphilus fuscans TaxID=2789292 RepID=UPI0018ACDECE|nr:HAMP domain-containing protein [Streptacidiphilus fuscans]